MSDIPKNAVTKSQIISMVICTLLLLVYVTLVTWVL